MPEADEQRDYRCNECARGVLTLKRYGIFVIGRCNCCGHYVEFELPDEALLEADPLTKQNALGAPESIPVHN